MSARWIPHTIGSQHAATGAWLAVLVYLLGCQGVPGELVAVDAESTPSINDAATDADAAQPSDANTTDALLTPIPDPVWPPDDPLPADFDFPPFINMPAPNHIVIAWRTVNVRTAQLRYGTTEDYGTVVDSVVDDRVHTADLGVLEPSTAYYYEVEILESSETRKGVFVTPGSQQWRFMHSAEFHAPSEAPNAVQFADQIRAFRPHVLVESGDMLDGGFSIANWRSYFRSSAPWISNLIILPVGSNHVDGEFGNPFLAFFFNLPNNERWYTTRYGQVEFFTLDSTFDDDQLEVEFVEPTWLADQAALAHDGQNDPTFVIGAWHYPACSTLQRGRLPQRIWVMDNFVDTFIDAGGIDLILTGHDKYFERALIDGTIPHVTANIGKLAPSSAGDNHPRCTTIRTLADTRSVLFGTVNGATIDVAVVNQDGTEIDTFAISK